MARGSARFGFFASPPAWAMESKPMKLEKRTAAAARNGPIRNGVPAATGTWAPSRVARAAAKSAWSNEKPATITMLPRANIRNISGTRVRS